MMTGMEYTIWIGAALISSFIGLGLFRIGEQQILKYYEETDSLSADGGSVLEKKWKVGMSTCNLILVFYLSIIQEINILTGVKIILLCTILWVCAWTDWKVYLIPNRVLLMGILFRGLLFVLEMLREPEGIAYIFIQGFVAAGGLLIAGLLCRIVIPGSIGFGDLKLFVVMGLYLGADNIWSAIFFTLVASFCYCVFLLVRKKATRRSVIPFAPFLLLGTVLAVFLHGV